MLQKDSWPWTSGYRSRERRRGVGKDTIGPELSALRGVGKVRWSAEARHEDAKNSC